MCREERRASAARREREREPHCESRSIDPPIKQPLRRKITPDFMFHLCCISRSRHLQNQQTSKPEAVQSNLSEWDCKLSEHSCDTNNDFVHISLLVTKTLFSSSGNKQVLYLFTGSIRSMISKEYYTILYLKGLIR